MKKKNQGRNGFMRMVLVFLGLMALPQGAEAGQDFYTGRPGMLGAGLTAPVIIMHDMYGERFIIDVMPAYWTASMSGCENNSKGSANGYGAALALKYEFSPHWGAVLAGGRGSSNEFSIPCSELAYWSNFEQSNSFVSGKYKLEYSESANFGLTYDPFSEPGGFRLPIFIGAVYGKGKSQGTEQYSGNKVVNVVYEVPGNINFIAGLSAEFNVWKLRFEPAAVVMKNGEQKTTWKSSDGSSGTGSYDGGGQANFLFGMKYVPWGLTYNYQITLGVTKLNIHSLTFSKNW